MSGPDWLAVDDALSIDDESIDPAESSSLLTRALASTAAGIPDVVMELDEQQLGAPAVLPDPELLGTLVTDPRLSDKMASHVEQADSMPARPVAYKVYAGRTALLGLGDGDSDGGDAYPSGHDADGPVPDAEVEAALRAAQLLPVHRFAAGLSVQDGAATDESPKENTMGDAAGQEEEVPALDNASGGSGDGAKPPSDARSAEDPDENPDEDRETDTEEAAVAEIVKELSRRASPEQLVERLARDAELQRRWRSGDRNAIAELVDHYEPLITGYAKELAKKYAVERDSDALADITQMGYMILLKKIGTWNPERKIQLLTYCVATLTPELRRYAKNSFFVVDAPDPPMNIVRSIYLTNSERRLAGQPPLTDKEIEEKHHLARIGTKNKLGVDNIRNLAAMTYGRRRIEMLEGDNQLRWGVVDLEIEEHWQWGETRQGTVNEALVADALDWLSTRGDNKLEVERNARIAKLLRLSVGYDDGDPRSKAELGAMTPPEKHKGAPPETEEEKPHGITIAQINMLTARARRIVRAYILQELHERSPDPEQEQ
jgi:hypothetical protein